MAHLTADNFENGFLVDDQLMAGVTRDPAEPDRFVAFVLQPASGEYLGYQSFETLEPALEAVNRIPRSWVFEAAGGCGGCAEGKCAVAAGGSCRKKSACAPCGDLVSSEPRAT